MPALKELFAKLGIEFDQKPVVEGAKAVDTFEQKLTKLNKEAEESAKGVKKTESAFISFAKGFLASGIVAGLASFVAGVVQSTLAQSDHAQALGLSTQSLLEWQHVAAASGVPVEVMNSGLQTLVQNMRSVQQGNSDVAYTFRRLQVPIRDANRNLRDTSDVMVEAGMAVARIENPTIRARLAMRVFGDAGRQLIPIFEQGGTAVESMREEVRQLIGGNLQAMEQQARRVRGEYSRLSLAYQGISNSIALILLPAFSWLINNLTWLVRETKRVIDTTYILQSVFVTAVPIIAALLGQLAVASWATFGPMILAMAPVALGVLAIVAVVDDLYALFNGGDSIIGRFLDSLLGVGEAKKVVEELKIAYEELVEGISRAIQGVIEALSRIPGVGHLLQTLGLTNPTVVQTQAERGFRPSTTLREGQSTSPIPALLRGPVVRGVIGPSSVATRSGGRPNDIRINNQVGNITIETGRDDGEAIANTIQGRLRNQQASSIRHAIFNLTHRVTDPVDSQE